MKIKEVSLERVAVKEDQYPEDDLPEIALAGRSNVGKSSFINRMINRKALARTSSKPGKTRTINFYKVNDDFRFVDLPGYGYAQVSKKEKDSWADIINTYLGTRENLKEVLLIVDIRHEPTDQDVQMFQWVVESGFKGVVIATKADKIARGKVDRHLGIIRKKLDMKNQGGLVLPFSATGEDYKDKIWQMIQKELGN